MNTLTTMIAIIGPMNDHTVPEFVDNQHLIVINGRIQPQVHIQCCMHADKI